MVGTEVIIQNLSAEDVPYILAMAEEYNLSFWSAEDYLHELKKTDSISIVAVINNLVVGFLIARLIMSEKSIEIYNLAVKKAHRKKGVGRNLIGDVLETANLHKLEKIFLEVRSLNVEAICFYQKLGFEITGKRKKFYTKPNDDALLLKLDCGV